MRKKKLFVLTVVVALLLAGCAIKEEKKARKSKTPKETIKTESNEESDEEAEEEKDERIVWTEFSKVDYAVLAAMLHSSTNEMQACELVDIDSDGEQELVGVREIEKWSPRQEVYVADVESGPYISYINDISPNGDADICIDKGRLYFGVNYASADSMESVLYEWNDNWKVIAEGENVAIPEGEDITDDYNTVENISIPNGNYEEIVRLFQEHLDSLNLTYLVSEEDDSEGGSKTTYEVEDYAASWKSNLSEYKEQEYVTFATDRKDSVAEIEIVLDEEGTVDFVITIDDTRTILVKEEKLKSDEELLENLQENVFYEPGVQDTFFSKYVFKKDGTYECTNVGVDGKDEGTVRVYNYHVENGKLYLSQYENVCYFYNEEEGVWQTEEQEAYWDELYQEYVMDIHYMVPYNGIVDQGVYVTMQHFRPKYGLGQ